MCVRARWSLATPARWRPSIHSSSSSEAGHPLLICIYLFTLTIMEWRFRLVHVEADDGVEHDPAVVRVEQAMVCGEGEAIGMRRCGEG